MPLMVDGAMAKNWNNKQKTYGDFPVHEFARSELRQRWSSICVPT